jgi:hypothetical protein
VARLAGQARGHLLLTALMDAALVLAVLLLIRLAIGFFGIMTVNPAGSWYLAVTRPLAVPVVGDWAVRTPYGGVFSVDAGIVILGLLVVEWALATMRRRRFPQMEGPR